jgi:uncharacterized RDD family membrane protein YckC
MPLYDDEIFFIRYRIKEFVMAWYYKDGEQEIGPVDKVQLQSLIKSKQINAQTLVRSENSDKWQTLQDATRSKPKQPPAKPDETQPVSQSRPRASVQSTGAPAAPVPSASSAVCSQCGRSFPVDQVVKYDDQVICTACKPLFVQRLREGVSAPVSQLQYAGFWIRVGAKMIDWIILGVVQQVINAFGALMMGDALDNSNPDNLDPASIAFVMGFVLVSFLLQIAYDTYFLGRFGATLGKMACGLKVVAPDGNPISYWRAMGRYFAEIVSKMTAGIGYLLVAFDSQKRALHDHICSTRVIRK